MDVRKLHANTTCTNTTLCTCLTCITQKTWDSSFTRRRRTKTVDASTSSNVEETRSVHLCGKTECLTHPAILQREAEASASGAHPTNTSWSRQRHSSCWRSRRKSRFCVRSASATRLENRQGHSSCRRSRETSRMCSRLRFWSASTSRSWNRASKEARRRKRQKGKPGRDTESQEKVGNVSRIVQSNQERNSISRLSISSLDSMCW